MSFRNNVLKLMSGVIAVQIIQLMTQPIITRLYTPDQFGKFSALSNTMVFLGTFLVFSYEFAIPALKTDSEAKELSQTLLVLTLPMALIISLLLVILEYKFNFFKFRSESLYLLLPIWIFCLGVNNILLNLNNRQRNFGAVAKRTVYATICCVLIQIGLGYSSQTDSGLYYGSVVSIILGTYLLLRPLEISILKLPKVNWALLKSSFHFIKHQFTGSIINLFSLMAPVVLLNYYATPDLAGNYALAIKVLSLPIMLITGSFAQVFYQEFARKFHAHEDCLGFVLSIWKRLFILSFPVCLLLFIFAKPLMVLVFGANWALSGVIVQYLSISTFASIMSSSTSSAFMVIGLASSFPKYTSLIAGFRLIGSYLMCKNMILGLLVIVISEILFRGLLNILIYLRLNKSSK